MKHDLHALGFVGTCRRCGLSGVSQDGSCDGGAGRTTEERVARLLRTFRAGERVRAVETIVYGTGEEVPEGSIGFIQRTCVNGCIPLVTVAWTDRGGAGQPPHIVQPCSVESLDPVDRRPG